MNDEMQYVIASEDPEMLSPAEFTSAIKTGQMNRADKKYWQS